MTDGDTIVALSSGALPAGVAVIRLSGPLAGATLAEVAGGLPQPRTLVYRRIAIGGLTVDHGLVAFMPGPGSFTGEDCAELQVHGSRAVVKTLLRQLTARPGLRLAEAGEFTRRAFENGKLDLVEAQGLADLIDAETENQRALALARMDGALTRRIEGWRSTLLDLRAEIEAQLDFSDEGDVGALPEGFSETIVKLSDDIGYVLVRRGQGHIVRSGFRVVLSGPPNVGKSSLLNAMAQSDVAIVSDEPGTTRDLKEVPLDINGQLVILIDSAGLRSTESKAEAAGISRAREAMQHAHVVLWLQAPDQPRQSIPTWPDLEAWQRPAVIVVGTKSDLGTVAGAAHSVSAVSGAGIPQLLETLYDAVGLSQIPVGDILVSHERDRAALLEATIELDRAREQLDRPELAGEDLRRASAALERLIGRIDAEQVLDRLFSSFCIGK